MQKHELVNGNFNFNFNSNNRRIKKMGPIPEAEKAVIKQVAETIALRIKEEIDSSVVLNQIANAQENQAEALHNIYALLHQRIGG